MNRQTLVTSLFVCILVTRLAADEPVSPDPDIALEPATLIVNPWRFHLPPMTARFTSSTITTARPTVPS